jgi:hypothetical protein
VNLEQARCVAEEYFNGARPLTEPGEVAIYSFKDGYVAWIKDPAEPEDPSVLPATAGGGCIVIDAATGVIATRPLLSPETVAAQYPGRTPR